MKTVHEVSQLTGCSVRTLHHYDAIGLLRPTQVTPAGYRLYDDAALRRLRTILLFRELRFPLRDIQAILDAPRFDPTEALDAQLALLEMQRDRLNQVIALARRLKEEGEDLMDFKPFDTTAQDAYAEEVKRRWGDMEAYVAYTRRHATPEEQKAAAEEMMAFFARLGAMRELAPEDERVQAEVTGLQNHITAHFYPCTEEMLRSLGAMYVEDERFRRNIDQAGGPGTAEFTRRAIDVQGRKN